MSLVLQQQPDIDELEQLFPLCIISIVGQMYYYLNEAAQVNYFDCGRIAVGVSVSHRVADALSMAKFAK
uniref:2-oxoacid dehydrogenase acyltransferase catalytic domain-containing protein n=1 Tax=Salix viminalis TaxID=40686 RepID=A0A6N2K7F2_SALVM